MYHGAIVRKDRANRARNAAKPTRDVPAGSAPVQSGTGGSSKAQLEIILELQRLAAVGSPPCALGLLREHPELVTRVARYFRDFESARRAAQLVMVESTDLDDVLAQLRALGALGVPITPTGLRAVGEYPLLRRVLRDLGSVDNVEVALQAAWRSATGRTARGGLVVVTARDGRAVSIARHNGGGIIRVGERAVALSEGELTFLYALMARSRHTGRRERTYAPSDVVARLLPPRSSSAPSSSDDVRALASRLQRKLGRIGLGDLIESHDGTAYRLTDR